ncbi:MAG TPA: thioredoxin [Campylobacterales bacterium]|nr:thioredoxin [Campylobacterales bacterium]HIO71397.1 thioredoxin [Campylobacterales bacterium]
MAKPLTLTSDNFDSTIENGVTLVDFWAPWCGPCRMVAPVIDELAEEYDGKATIGKVNTDEQQMVAVKYGIRSIPTLIIFKDGQPVDQIIGAVPKQVLTSKLESVLNS